MDQEKLNAVRIELGKINMMPFSVRQKLNDFLDSFEEPHLEQDENILNTYTQLMKECYHKAGDILQVNVRPEITTTEERIVIAHMAIAIFYKCTEL